MRKCKHNMAKQVALPSGRRLVFLFLAFASLLSPLPLPQSRAFDFKLHPSLAHQNQTPEHTRASH
jgi:hypothetical protein